MTNELSVEEAIKMLKSKMDGHTDTSYEWTETVRMAIEALEQTSWIPVSERLPEEDVIVQINNGGDRFFDIAHVVKMKHPAFDTDFYWEARHPWDDSSIEAWMPLPEPYKESDNNENN